MEYRDSDSTTDDAAAAGDGGEMNRRQFMGAAGVSAGAVFVGSLPAAKADEPPGNVTRSEDAEDAWDGETDVAVAGGALGGCLAALAAQNQGADVVCFEAGSDTGGTALGSTGVIHTWGASNMEMLQTVAPDVDEELGQVLVDELGETLQWIDDQGFPGSSGETSRTIGGNYEARREFFDHFNATFQDQGGTLLTNTPVVALVLDGHGTPIGVLADEEGGGRVAISASNIVLATGGFQASPGLKTMFYGRGADNTVHRSVPYNRGDGMRMARAAGARISRGAGGFYGHLVPFPSVVPQHDPGAYEDFGYDELNERLTSIMPFSPYSVAVNINGNRFTDESLVDDLWEGTYRTEGLEKPYGYGDEIIAQDVSSEPLGVGYVVFDSEIGQISSEYEPQTALNRNQAIEEWGGAVAQADTVEGLADQLYRLSPGVASTIETYNEAIESEDQSLLDVPRRTNRYTVDSPPYYAVKATAGVSHTYGGVAIDDETRALSQNERPIPNLYAVPATAGGVSQRFYVGGLVQNAVFGKLAGEAAAADTSGTN